MGIFMRTSSRLSYFIIGALVLLAGSTVGAPYLATFLAILPLAFVLRVLIIPLPVLLLIYALLPGLGVMFSKQDKKLYATVIFILYPVVLSIFLIYIALVEPGQLLQTFITLITIWLSALFLGKTLTNTNLLQEVLEGLVFLEILSPLGALIAKLTNSFHGDLDIMLVSALEAAGGTLGPALWYRISKNKIYP